MTDVRVTQEPVLVLHGGADSDARVTQEPVLVLHGGITSNAVVTQEAVLVLSSPRTITTSEEYGNYPIYQGDPYTGLTYISGTWDYTVLLGTIETATYESSGTVTFTNGVGTIRIGPSDVGDPAILVLQNGESIGAFNVVISNHY